MSLFFQCQFGVLRYGGGSPRGRNCRKCVLFLSSHARYSLFARFVPPRYSLDAELRVPFQPGFGLALGMRVRTARDSPFFLMRTVILPASPRFCGILAILRVLTQSEQYTFLARIRICGILEFLCDSLFQYVMLNDYLVVCGEARSCGCGFTQKQHCKSWVYDMRCGRAVNNLGVCI